MAQVTQKPSAPCSNDTSSPGPRVYPAEYRIDTRLRAWGYDQKRVNQGRGEDARDDEGDGCCAVHVQTLEGFWSLWRSWLRPHRGLSQEQRPRYLGVLAFVHNVSKRGKALLQALMALLVT